MGNGFREFQYLSRGFRVYTVNFVELCQSRLAVVRLMTAATQH